MGRLAGAVGDAFAIGGFVGFVGDPDTELLVPTKQPQRVIAVARGGTQSQRVVLARRVKRVDQV